MKTKTTRAVDPKPCENCGHCPTCGHAPREVVKVVPVPMPYPVPAPHLVYPWGYRPFAPYWSVIGGGTYVGDLPSSGTTFCNVSVPQQVGVPMNCN